LETVKVLVGEGADMFLRNASGRDAVWEAEQRGHEGVVQWMLGTGEERPVGEVVEGQSLEEEDREQTVQGDAMDIVNGDVTQELHMKEDTIPEMEGDVVKSNVSA
jgi:hypothetical protein